MMKFQKKTIISFAVLVFVLSSTFGLISINNVAALGSEGSNGYSVTVSGVVKNGVGGKVSGATVRAGSGTTTTNSYGQYTVTGVVTMYAMTFDGKISFPVTASKSGYKTRSTTVVATPNSGSTDPDPLPGPLPGPISRDGIITRSVSRDRTMTTGTNPVSGVTITIYANTRVYGYVTDEQTGLRASGATVRVYFPGGYITRTTDSNGYYSVTYGAPAGYWRVSGWKGYATGSVSQWYVSNGGTYYKPFTIIDPTAVVEQEIKDDVIGSNDESQGGILELINEIAGYAFGKAAETANAAFPVGRSMHFGPYQKDLTKCNLSIGFDVLRADTYKLEFHVTKDESFIEFPLPLVGAPSLIFEIGLVIGVEDTDGNLATLDYTITIDDIETTVKLQWEFNLAEMLDDLIEDSRDLDNPIYEAIETALEEAEGLGLVSPPIVTVAVGLDIKFDGAFTMKVDITNPNFEAGFEFNGITFGLFAEASLTVSAGINTGDWMPDFPDWLPLDTLYEFSGKFEVTISARLDILEINYNVATNAVSWKAFKFEFSADVLLQFKVKYSWPEIQNPIELPEIDIGFMKSIDSDNKDLIVWKSDTITKNVINWSDSITIGWLADGTF